MREMLEAMRAGGDAETLRAIAAEPEVEPPFVADPESPAAVKLAEEIWRDTVEEKSRQARREAHERELDAKLEEELRKMRPEYCGCTHPFKQMPLRCFLELLPCRYFKQHMIVG